MKFSVPVLDSRDVVGLQSGPHGLNILSKIKFNHFRIREMGQWRNIAPFAKGYDKHDMFVLTVQGSQIPLIDDENHLHRWPALQAYEDTPSVQ
jgi:hypothetical protein